jgi:hypothetical protein
MSSDINQHVLVGCLRDGCVCDPTFGKCTRCYAADTIQALSDRASAAEARAERLREAILWADGRIGEWPERQPGEGAFYWRKELMRRAGLEGK